MANKIFRVGKTRRDRSRGAAKNNKNNKQARGDWNNTQTMIRSNSRVGMGAFPYASCNGKRNKQFSRKKKAKLVGSVAKHI